MDAFGCNSLIYSAKRRRQARIRPSTRRVEALLPQIRDKAHLLGLKFLWYTPTQYCDFDPVQLGLGVKAAQPHMINACVGPNGDVYPCQSYFESLGNILTEPWEKIWNNPLAVKLRRENTWKKNAKTAANFRSAAADAP